MHRWEWKKVEIFSICTTLEANDHISMRNQELWVQNKKKKDIRQLMVKLEWNEGERICIRQKQPPEGFYVHKKFAIIIGKHLCWSLFLMTLQVLSSQIYQKETPIQVLSCGICKFFKNTYFEEHLREIASKQRRVLP